jgi:2-methylcitrate dehydratase PrpD
VSDFTDEAIADPAVLEVAGKVRYETREYPTYPQAFPGGVRITLSDGRTIEGDLPHQKGGPENPLSADDVRAKFHENASLVLGSDDLTRLERAILSLDEQSDIGAAVAPLTLSGVVA